MGKLTGIDIKSILGSISIYQVNGHTYVRSKSSLSRKRVLKSKEYARTRQYASNMAKASQIGSEIYRELNKRNRALYQAITGAVASMLYNGVEEEQVKQIIRKNILRAELFKSPSCYTILSQD
jgi:hypothetical protein